MADDLKIKFDRKYLLLVETNDGNTIEVKPPFTVEFDITRNYFSSANVSSIRIYNLSKEHRNQIRKDQQAYYDQRQVLLKAGYGPNLPTIFNGYIQQAWSVREGTNMITQLESYDGGPALIQGTANRTYQKGTDVKSVVEDLIGTLPGVSLGAVGDYSGKLTRGIALSGNTADQINQLTGNGMFIDNGKVFVLQDGEVLEGELQVLDNSSGLLGTPVREPTLIHFDMIFEPRLFIGQQVALQSLTADNFNGTYKVISLHHRGMISEAVCGDAITTVGLLAPPDTKVVGNAQ